MSQSLFLRSLVDDDHIVRSDDLRSNLVEKSLVDVCAEHLCHFILSLRSHIWLVFEEVVDVGPDEFAVLPGCSTLDSLLISPENHFLGPCGLGSCESVFLHLPDFGQVGLVGRDSFGVPAGNLSEH